MQMEKLGQDRGRKLCMKGPNERLSTLYNTNFGDPNNVLQRKLLIRALYIHLIEKGDRNTEKDT